MTATRARTEPQCAYSQQLDVLLRQERSPKEVVPLENRVSSPTLDLLPNLQRRFLTRHLHDGSFLASTNHGILWQDHPHRTDNVLCSQVSSLDVKRV